MAGYLPREKRAFAWGFTWVLTIASASSVSEISALIHEDLPMAWSPCSARTPRLRKLSRVFPAIADGLIAAGFAFERDALPN